MADRKVLSGAASPVHVVNQPTASVSTGLTDAQLRATPVIMTGAVIATGPLTDDELRDTPVPVTGPLTDTQLRDTAVPVSGPLTDTQLRDSAVPVLNGPVLVAAADSHAPADNTAAIVTYTGIASTSHVISGIAWSYDADPTGGSLIITDNGAVVFTVFITKGGPGVFVFPIPKKADVAHALVITLAAGGGTVQGTVSILNHWLV